MNRSLLYALSKKATAEGIRSEQAVEEAIAKYVGVPLPGYCKKCRSWNHSKANYCNQCGNKLEAIS